MKISFRFLLIIIILVGCATLDQVRTKNRENLFRLVAGMQKAEVLKVMGTETIKAMDSNLQLHLINNPWQIEIVKGKADQMYEVLFYHTDVNTLTPIVFKDGKLIGWGRAFLNGVLH